VICTRIPKEPACRFFPAINNKSTHARRQADKIVVMATPSEKPCFTSLIGLLVTACLLSGCIVERVVYNPWDDLPADPKPVLNRTTGKTTAPRRWAIAIEHFEGPHRHTKAMALSKKIGAASDLTDMWIQGHGNWTTLYCGRFDKPNSAKAQAALRKVHSISLDEQQTQTFAAARMVPLSRGSSGRTIAAGQADAAGAPHNLQQYAGFYTHSLQVGYYDENFDGDRYKAAEKAVAVWREQGEEAYYYHGRHRSMVTVGVFTHEQAFTTAQNPLAPGTLIERWSQVVRSLQQKHPHNLGNGLTLIEKVNGKKIGEQPSSLVRIPG
jgi:hypothetical protein